MQNFWVQHFCISGGCLWHKLIQHVDFKLIPDISFYLEKGVSFRLRKIFLTVSKCCKIFKVCLTILRHCKVKDSKNLDMLDKSRFQYCYNSTEITIRNCSTVITVNSFAWNAKRFGFAGFPHFLLLRDFSGISENL